MKSLMELIEAGTDLALSLISLQREPPFVIVGYVSRDVVDSTIGIRIGHARTGSVIRGYDVVTAEWMWVFDAGEIAAVGMYTRVRPPHV
jgi:hypothetical protein